MFGARQLVCCASAMADFRTILGTLGGPGERERGEELIKRIQVVPDQTSLKTERLATSGKIRKGLYCTLHLDRVSCVYCQALVPSPVPLDQIPKQ